MAIAPIYSTIRLSAIIASGAGIRSDALYPNGREESP